MALFIDSNTERYAYPPPIHPKRDNETISRNSTTTDSPPSATQQPLVASNFPDRDLPDGRHNNSSRNTSRRESRTSLGQDEGSDSGYNSMEANRSEGVDEVGIYTTSYSLQQSLGLGRSAVAGYDEPPQVPRQIYQPRTQDDREARSMDVDEEPFSVRRSNSGPERGFSRQPKDYESLGIINHHGPNNPSYATVEARLRTFSEWPPALGQKPQELADAGFYYLGLSDQVKCFYCDGGLRNWQPEDDPWVEHARWFSKCVFVRLRKGDDFIKNCIDSKPPENEGMHNAYASEVTEEDLRKFMSEAIVRQVLSMGICPSRVKMAIKKQLQDYGSNFDSTESLVSAALSVHRQQERRVQNEHNNPSGAMLGGQTHSFDEVTSRRWENEAEMYNSTEDEDEPPNFHSLPAGVNLSANKPTNSSAASAATPSKAEVSKPAAAAASQDPTTPKAAAAATPAVQSPAASADSLEEENQRLKEQRTCKVCMDGEVGVVFLPCGHLICCVNCAPSLKDCPVCRTNIQGTVRTFMS